jgi:hypothetical protein
MPWSFVHNAAAAAVLLNLKPPPCYCCITTLLPLLLLLLLLLLRLRCPSRNIAGLYPASADEYEGLAAATERLGLGAIVSR